MNSLYESYWPFIYIISHLLFQKYMWKPTLYWHCKHCSSSCKGLWAIIVCFVSFIDKLMQFCSYIYSINLFYLSIAWLNTISTGFFLSQQRRWVYFFSGATFVSAIWMILLSQNIWSRCMILTDHLSTLFFISFFNHIIWNRLSTDTVTAVAPVKIDNGQSLFILFVASIHSYD